MTEAHRRKRKQNHTKLPPKKKQLKDLKQELAAYGNAEFSPARNALSKLLSAGSVSLMLSQPDTAIHFGEVMDQGKILLVNLSRISSQVRGIVGSLLMSLFHQETLRRSEVLEANFKCTVMSSSV